MRLIIAIAKYQNGLGIDNKLKLKTDTVSKYFLQDHLGSTTALTNSSGSIVESATYDSFGNATGNLSTRYGYTGREFDADLGLQYSRARWYDATLGRFISEDPIGFAGGDVNLYGYVWNSPIKLVDPMGTDGGATLVLGGGALIGGEGLGALGAAAAGPPGQIVAGGAILIYGAWHFGEYIARRRFPEQFPDTQPKAKPETSCDPKPNPEPKPAPLPVPFVPSPNTSATPRPFTPPDEPKRTCTKTGELNLPNGQKRCIYKCSGGGFPGFYNIGATVNANESCPNPDKNDNDWIPGGS